MEDSLATEVVQHLQMQEAAQKTVSSGVASLGEVLLRVQPEVALPGVAQLGVA